MPTLSQATSLTLDQLGASRIRAVGPSEPRASSPPSPLFGNGTQNTRCPVPPFSISPDSLSTYDASGLTPQARLIASLPLFQDTGSGTTTTITKTVSARGSSGSTGVSSGANTSTSSTTSPIPTNVGFTTPSISGGVPYQTTIQMAPLFLLYRVSVNVPARVELYATAAAQTSDQGRDNTTSVALGGENEIIGDFSLGLITETPWLCSPVATGYNGDSPISDNVYVTVTNLSTSTVPITVTLAYLPLGEPA